MRKLWFGCLLSLPLAAHAMTLEESFVSALGSDPGLLRQYAAFNTRLEERGIVTSEYYPQVSVRAGIGPEKTEYSSGQLIDEELTRDEAGLRIGWMLFSGFSTQANSKRLEFEAEAERKKLIAAAEDLALQVSEVYLEMLQADQLMTLSQRHVSDHLAILEDVKKLAVTGFANDGDIAQVVARLANARASLVAATNNYQDVHARFLNLVNQEPVDLVDPVPDNALLPQTLTQAMDWARDAHPQLQAAMADIDAAQQEVRASKSGFYPRVSLEGYANKGHDLGGFSGPEEDYRVMMVVEYDLFNGGRDSSRVKTSNWRYNEAMAIRVNTERDLIEGTRLSWNAYQSLKTQQSLLQESVDASSLAEEAYLTQYKLGKRSLLDLLNAKVELFVARKNYLDAKYDQIQSEFRLMNSTGRLGYALRAVYPQEWSKEEAE